MTVRVTAVGAVWLLVVAIYAVTGFYLLAHIEPQEQETVYIDRIIEVHHEMPTEPGWHVTWLWATGYAPFDNKSGICNDGNPSSTASGTYPTWGTIAVNPRIIPYGTKMYIEGYGWGVAEDTGSAIRARTDLIDLYFDTHEEAMTWGRRRVMVVLEVRE